MPILRPEHVAFLNGTRRGVLATVAPSGLPRLVPICFAVVDGDSGPVLYSALDEKPKHTTDPHALARVRDLVARPRVSLLADRWDEDWRRLAWLRVEAVGGLLEPGGPEHERAVLALRARYRQYGTHALEAVPLLRFAPTRAVWWSGAALPQGNDPGPGSRAPPPHARSPRHGIDVASCAPDAPRRSRTETGRSSRDGWWAAGGG